MRKMKNSGIEWVGDIPDNWDIQKIKYYVKTRDENGVYNPDNDLYLGLENIKGYSNDIIETDTEYSLSVQSRYSKGDVLFGKLRPYLAKVIQTKNSGFCSSEFLVISSFKGDKKFLRFALLNPQFKENINSSTYGAKMPRANTSYILNQKIAIPPIEEQRKIAEFLDEKCGEIDALIADIKAQIESLEQYKRSVICEAVTKGLNPSAEMKDSGAGWMPTVPKHWAVEKFKFHLRIRAQKNMGDKQVLSLYRDYGVVPKDSRDDNHNVTSEDTSTYRFVRVGDFVVNKMKAWQGSVAVSQYEGIVSPAYFVYEFTDNLFNKQYFHYLLRNKSYTTEFMRLSGGIRVGQWDLPAEALENILVLIPPIEEQKQIADYLDNKCAQIEELKTAKQSQIETLEAYKKSIIYEYVTGKKEVG